MFGVFGGCYQLVFGSQAVLGTVFFTVEGASGAASKAMNLGQLKSYPRLGVESILKNSLYRQSLDNVTVVMVAF